MISSKPKSCVAACAFLFLGLLFVGGGAAQVAGGTILGIVRDTSGAAIAGAKVAIQNMRTGIITAVTTNEYGLYRAPNLKPGPYQVNVFASGFATLVEKDLTLEVGAELAVNLQLRVGGVNDRVEVTGEVPDVATSNSTVSTVVNERTIQELPLNARDWTLLANLEPGVANVRMVGLNANPGRVNRGWGSQLTIGGNRAQQNNYRMNGVSMNDYANGAPGSVLGGDLGVDAIQEFSVVTSNAQAEYGRSSGGIINAITRSGTNAFHGSVYEFLRNSALDARSVFDILNGQPIKPPFKQQVERMSR